MREKNWAQRIELIASVSVVVTLVMLIVEVRANTGALERQVLLDRAANVATPFMEGPELLEAFRRVKSVDGWGPLETEFMERYGLEPAQSVAWMFFLYKVWSGLEADHAFSGPSDELTGSIQGLLAFPDNQLYWKQAAGQFSPEFIAYVEEVAPSPGAEEQALAGQETPREAIDDAYRNWVDATNAKDLDRWATFLAPDPLFLPPDHDALRGEPAIRDFYDSLFADSRFALNCRQEQVTVSEGGDMAWSTGSCEATFTDPNGEAARGSSKWAKVWKRLPNGDWKCALNSWSLNGPSAGGD
jgi:ketosteroid isomerase-like protein